MSAQQTNSCSLFLPESGSLSLKHKLNGEKKEVFQSLKFFETQEDTLISSKQLEVRRMGKRWVKVYNTVALAAMTTIVQCWCISEGSRGQEKNRYWMFYTLISSSSYSAILSSDSNFHLSHCQSKGNCSSLILLLYLLCQETQRLLESTTLVDLLQIYMWRNVTRTQVSPCLQWRSHRWHKTYH